MNATEYSERGPLAARVHVKSSDGKGKLKSSVSAGIAIDFPESLSSQAA